MQINYYVTPGTNLHLYNFTLAKRHFYALTATKDRIDDLIKEKILSPDTPKTEPSYGDWTFHLVFGLAEFLLPILGLFIAAIECSIFHKEPAPLPVSYSPPTQSNPKPDYAQEIKKLHTLEMEGFFKTKNHESAKEKFKEVMGKHGLAVNYVNAEGWDYNVPNAPLDPSIFYWSPTDDVGADIHKAAQDTKRVHLFSAASQYNAAEAPSRYTPPLGKAMYSSEYDGTQGPRAQRTNPVVFEWVTAYLTHLGFNMMEYALPSAGKTYMSGAPIEHGYLCPTDQNIEPLANELETNFRKYEAPCYESRIKDAKESIYLLLGAAPALGYGHIDKSTTAAKKLQYWAYVANMTTQFKQALHFLKENPEKDVVLHMTGTGVGVFGCLTEVFAEAFLKTASVFQSQLSKSEKGRIRVQMEAWTGGSFDSTCSNLLKLQKKPRAE